MSLRILMLNHNYYSEGTYFRCFFLAKELVKRGHSVTIFTVSRDRKFSAKTTVESGVTVVHQPNWGHDFLPAGSWGPLDIIGRIWHLWHSPYDIVHLFEHHANVSVPFAVVRHFKRRTIYLADWADWFGGGIHVFRGSKVAQRIDQFFEERIKRTATGVTVISTVLRDRALHIGVQRESVRLVREGADLCEISPPNCREHQMLRYRYGIESHETVLLFVGSYQVDLDLVIPAFEQILESVPNARLVIIGKKTPHASALIEASHIPFDRFVQTGFCPTDELRDWLRLSDVCLLPLRDTTANRGRWPHKIGDYLCAGKPVVTNAVGDVGQFVAEQGCGLLVDSSVAGFAEGIRSWLQMTAQERAALAARARKAAEEHLDWSGIVDALEGFYLEAKRVAADKAGAVS